MGKAAWLASVCAALGISAAAAQDKPVAGKVELTTGDVMIEAPDGTGRLPAVGDNVRTGDVVTTFSGGEIHLRMVDGAFLALRESTKITIKVYEANGDDGDRSVVELARGTLRAITGWIGRYRRQSYIIRTPLVTIGVRGTDHEPTHLPPGDPRGEPGSYDKVNEGATFIQSPRGMIEVPASRAVHFAHAGAAAPQLLASLPAFFKPTRNEERFLAQARESVRTLEAQREARREFVRKNPAIRQKPAAQKFAPEKAHGEAKGAQRQTRESRSPQKPPAARPRTEGPAQKAFTERRAERRAERPQRPAEKKRQH